MKTVQVVPLRRLAPDRPWFSYLVPDGLHVQPGQLAYIPFGRQHLEGVIWSVSEQSSDQAKKLIHGLVRPEPVMTDFQRNFLAQIAEQHFISLGQLVRLALPTFVKPRTAPVIGLVQPGGTPPPDMIWWYRDRQHGMKAARNWLRSQSTGIRVAIAPTVEQAERLQVEAGGWEGGIGLVHHELPPGQYSFVYQGILRGQITRLVGTSRALLLPYPAEPAWLIDQEDHRGHKLHEHAPRLDVRVILAGASQVAYSTCSPTVRLYHSQLLVPTPRIGTRALAGLGHGNPAIGISVELESIMSEPAHGLTVLLAPHAGYARHVSCRTCGYTAVCSECQSPLQPDSDQADKIDCRMCGWRTSLPTACPTCRGVDWKLGRPGLGAVRRQLERRFTSVQFRTTVENSHASMVIATPLETNWLEEHREAITNLIVLQADLLRTLPDFSSDERAWLLLARWEAMIPKAAITVQTYHPDSDFWQRWCTGDDRRWYEDELAFRKQAHLPPWSEQWIAWWPGKNSKAITDSTRQILQNALPGGVTVTALLGKKSQTSAATRLLITAEHGQLRNHANWAQLLPHPWQIDTTPDSWW